MHSKKNRKSNNKNKKQRVSTHKIELAILKYTNIERRKRGLPPLKLDPKLTKTAQGHSRDMAKRGYFSHITNHKGPIEIWKDPTQRAQKYGFKGGVAENISKVAFHHNNADQMGKYLVRGWAKSPGHAANMFNNYDRIGIGVSYRGKWTIATQNFADNPPSLLRRIFGINPPVKRYSPGIFADQ